MESKTCNGTHTIYVVLMSLVIFNQTLAPRDNLSDLQPLLRPLHTAQCNLTLSPPYEVITNPIAYQYPNMLHMPTTGLSSAAG